MTQATLTDIAGEEGGGGADAEERETAVRFTRSFMETAPHLRDDGEIAYSGRF